MQSDIISEMNGGELRRFRKPLQDEEFVTSRRSKRVCIRNDDDVEEHNCGTMSEVCVFCGALYWKEEKNTAHKYTKCCHDGKVDLPAFPDAPELLKKFLTENLPDVKNYRQRIREYNSGGRGLYKLLNLLFIFILQQ